MSDSLFERLVILVEEQVKNAKTPKEKAENLQLLEQLQNEQKNPSKDGTKKILFALVKHFATHGVIELFKELL